MTFNSNFTILPMHLSRQRAFVVVYANFAISVDNFRT